LVVVSKTIPANGIMEAYNAGQRIFGEKQSSGINYKIPGIA
jgi:uncharacterized pyridoxal phosphate-containing UPF0001 family protein